MSPTVRGAVHSTIGILLFLAVLAGIGAAGMARTSSQSHAGAPVVPESAIAPQGRMPDEGQTVVAVAVGATGSATGGVLPSYEVFARSDRFFVYTVAQTMEPVPLSGGLNVLPDHTFTEVESGAVPAPDVVVVPAVADPRGGGEASLREWLSTRYAAGARMLGVCAGSRLLAAAGLLDGRKATASWSDLPALERRHPEADWIRGRHYVEDGAVVTTAGIASGIAGALYLVEDEAGAEEAERIGADIAYPGWSADGDTEIPVRRPGAGDLSRGLHTLFPWLRPTYGVGVMDGVNEIDVAAAFELYSATASATRTVPVSSAPVVTTRHGVRLLAHPAGDGLPRLDRLVVPGVNSFTQVDPMLRLWATNRGIHIELSGYAPDDFGFDPILRDLAAGTDLATARTTAKLADYPVSHLDLEGAAWPWRPTLLLLLALAVSFGAALTPGMLYRRRKRRAAAG